jgi:DNA-binding transcriptional LysR family regulator
MESLSGFLVFVQVAETRSFVAAGRLLGVSASAVGKRIARLEERLGVRLFHRSTRSITLTTDGTQFLERSRRILAEIEAVQLEMSQSAGSPRGRLRVSLPLLGSLLLPVLADFMLAYPEIELDLDFSDRIVDVIDEGFDVVVRTGALPDSRLAARRIGSFGTVLVAAPAYFTRHGKPQQPADLNDHVCLHYRYPTSGKLESWPLLRDPGGREVTLPISMVCNNVETRTCFAMRGLGIACVPDFSVWQALKDGLLCTVLDDYVGRETELSVVWPAGRSVPPRLRVFIDFIAARLLAKHESEGESQHHASAA